MQRFDSIHIDLVKETAEIETGGQRISYGIGTPEGFAAISQAWLRSGWDVKQIYSFTWMGRPIIQLPEDMFRIQEVIFRVKPDVILECGVAHGGSLVFYASLCKAMGKGRVIGVDVEIRPHNRVAIEAHFLFPYITLIEGSSIDPAIAAQAANLIQPGETVMVMLDSNHSKNHVLGELEAYGRLVTPGSYIVAMDGIMELVKGGPRTKPDWGWNNPRQAALEFASRHPEFVIEEPAFLFNEGVVKERVTYWPDAFLRRK
jgi:cephalosporin hydroxylase